MKTEKKFFNIFLILTYIVLYFINLSQSQDAANVDIPAQSPTIVSGQENTSATQTVLMSPEPIASPTPTDSGIAIETSVSPTSMPADFAQPSEQNVTIQDILAPATPAQTMADAPIATVETKDQKRAKKPPLKKTVEAKARKKIKSMADIPDEKSEADTSAMSTEKDIEKIKTDEAKGIYLGQYLEPWKNLDPNETIEMNFDNDEITELIKFLEDNLNITFILDDYVDPKRADGLKPIAGTKVTFKSHRPLTLKEVWQIGLTFLEMSGFSVTPTTLEKTYHITNSVSQEGASANKAPLPTFIGTDSELVPDSDIKIRYVYFIENADIETISKVIDAMRSSSSAPIVKFPELKAVIMTDKAANIKSLLKILEEIDKVTMPETLAIIRLKHADATKIRELYTELIGKGQQQMFPFRPKKTPTTQYFTEATRVFDDPRTNSLIVLGTRDNIKKFEEFIFKYVDRKSDLPYSPLYIMQLKYIDAESISKILNDVIQKFNADASRSTASAVGGIRDGNKFFKPTVKITGEPSGNRLVINADYDDYLKLRDIIEKLDVEQPQVAIKVLILNVDLSNTNELGVQLRNKVNCCDGSGNLDTLTGRNVNFQTSGIAGNGPIITNNAGTGAVRLLGNLINLANSTSATGGIFDAGTTLVTLGQDIFGFWGLLNALESYTRVSVIANPFLVTNNKYKAEITIGETRRVTSAIVQGQQTTTGLQDLSANLSVIITPQISYDDMVKLNVYVQIAQFDAAADTVEGPGRTIKQVSTEALAANKEVIALGGLIKDTVSELETKVPILGDIPLIGWLFKNKQKIIRKNSLLILISPEIIKAHEPETAQKFTYQQLQEVKETLYSMQNPMEKRDPIHRWLFNDHKDKEISTIDKFTSTQKRYVQAGKQEKIKPVLAYNDKPKTKKKSLLDFVDSKSDKKSGVVA